MTSKAGGRTTTGSSMSSKQIARSVLHGRKVTFCFDSGKEISGYVAGMDDFHWLLITPEKRKRLIHKGSASVIDLADENTYKDEPNKEALEDVIAPFRTAMEKLYRGQEVPEMIGASS